MEKDSSPSAHWQKETVSRADVDRDLCPGKATAQRAAKDQLEADYRLAREVTQRCGANAHLVRHAMEDRNVSQDFEIRLQGGRIQATDIGASGQPHIFLLYSGLANLLDDHDEPLLARGAANSSAYHN